MVQTLSINTYSSWVRLLHWNVVYELIFFLREGACVPMNMNEWVSLRVFKRYRLTHLFCVQALLRNVFPFCDRATWRLSKLCPWMHIFLRQSHSTPDSVHRTSYVKVPSLFKLLLWRFQVPQLLPLNILIPKSLPFFVGLDCKKHTFRCCVQMFVSLAY